MLCGSASQRAETCRASEPGRSWTDRRAKRSGRDWTLWLVARDQRDRAGRHQESGTGLKTGAGEEAECWWKRRGGEIYETHTSRGQYGAQRQRGPKEVYRMQACWWCVCVSPVALPTLIAPSRVAATCLCPPVKCSSRCRVKYNNIFEGAPMV